jgi:ABC-type phosphate transport system substrate-binding protein
MRKTSDLVDEMLTEAKKVWLVAIAVGFENETKFVFSSRRHPLEELNQLVQKGGSPLGLLRFEKENATIQGSYRPFEEYENEAWVKEYLAGLLANVGDIVALSQHKHSFPTAY